MKTTNYLLAIAWLLVVGCAYYTFAVPFILNHILTKPIGIEESKQMPTISERHVYTPAHKGHSWTRYGNCIDTIQGSDTLYIYPLKSYNKSGTLELVIQADSLSGSTGATLSIERSDLGLVWMPDI